LPPELIAFKQSDGGQVVGNEVVWTIAGLAPREQKTLIVITKSDKLVSGAVNRVVATAAPGLSANDQVNFDVFGRPGLHVEVRIDQQPVIVGKNVKYSVSVINTGAAPATEIDLQASLPPELQPVAEGTTGQTAPNIAGQVVTFGRIASLGAQQQAKYEVEARALRPGDVRFRVEMRSASLTDPQPVLGEQATRIIEAAP
jgi:uncharacterized repeat protein (TIGR01451 family)